MFLKAVNPSTNAVEAAIHLAGDFKPKAATMPLITPGGETMKNSIEQPDSIKTEAAKAVVENQTIKFTMPALSAGVLQVTP